MEFKRSHLEEKSFLVVDDFGDMRSLIKNMLLSCGAGDIVAVMNGAQAIEAMKTQRFDVVLCDYNLGAGKDGQQVLEEARHGKLIGLGTVFVMITAENAREMVMGAVDYEPDSYLTKPFNKELLRSRLEKLLVKKQNLLPIEQAVENLDYSLAISMLDQKIAGSPPNIGELNKLKGEVCLLAGDIEQALMVYEKILAVRDMSWARLGLGKTLFAAKRYSEAQTIFQELINANSRYTAAYDWLARTHKCLHEFEAAEDVLEQATKLSPKVVSRQRLLGEIALNNKHIDLAESAFSTAVKFGRHSVYKHPSIYTNLAKVVSETKAGEEGLKVLKDMQREFDGSSEVEFYRSSAESVIHQRLENSEKSQEALDQAVKLFDRLDQNDNPDLTIELAKTYGKLGDDEKASELLQQAVRNNHADEEILSELGATMESIGLLEDSRELIAGIRKEIVRLNNKGADLAKAGKLRESIMLFEEAGRGMPANKVINLNAARVIIMEIEQSGEYAGWVGKARLYLDRVKKSDPNDQGLKKLTEKLQKLASSLS